MTSPHHYHLPIFYFLLTTPNVSNQSNNYHSLNYSNWALTSSPIGATNGYYYLLIPPNVSFSISSLHQTSYVTTTLTTTDIYIQYSQRFRSHNLYKSLLEPSLLYHQHSGIQNPRTSKAIFQFNQFHPHKENIIPFTYQVQNHLFLPSLASPQKERHLAS